MLTLYYARDTISLATHILLEEVGATYATVRVDFGKTEQRSVEYMKINPKARVPALVTEHGVLTETPAMLVYVAQQFRVLATGVTRFALGKHDVKNAIVVLPPVGEQAAICKQIVDECRPLDDAIARAQEEIKLIREGNAAAALSLGGVMTGLAIPLAASLAASTSVMVPIQTMTVTPSSAATVANRHRLKNT